MILDALCKEQKSKRAAIDRINSLEKGIQGRNCDLLVGALRQKGICDIANKFNTVADAILSSTENHIGIQTKRSLEADDSDKVSAPKKRCVELADNLAIASTFAPVSPTLDTDIVAQPRFQVQNEEPTNSLNDIQHQASAGMGCDSYVETSSGAFPSNTQEQESRVWEHCKWLQSPHMYHLLIIRYQSLTMCWSFRRPDIHQLLILHGWSLIICQQF